MKVVSSIDKARGGLHDREDLDLLVLPSSSEDLVLPSSLLIRQGVLPSPSAAAMCLNTPICGEWSIPRFSGFEEHVSDMEHLAKFARRLSAQARF